jgi:hypothetical protein
LSKTRLRYSMKLINIREVFFIKYVNRLLIKQLGYLDDRILKPVEIQSPELN